MKILNDLSIKDLKLNKKRSLVIIIGIILSTALICGVAGLITSFQHTAIEYEKRDSGNYHATFYDVPKQELKYIEENRNVKDYYLSEELGYAYLKNSQNENKPYLNVISVSDKYLKNMGLQLNEGRMPENSEEIVISKHIITNGKVEYKIGDKITLDIGERQLTTGEKLNQNNPYLTGEKDNGEVLEEQIVNTNTKTYTIVGIIKRPSNAIENYEAPGYTVITKMEEVNKKANISVVYKKVSKYQEYTEQINQMVKAETSEEKENAKSFTGLRDASYKSYKYEVQLNYYLLAYEGANLSDGTMEMLYMLGGIIMGIILVSSVFVIRNGFAISITERLKQYGMLSSIGATKKQVKKSVYFEGITLGLIGIPLGILSGIFAINILLKVVNFILQEYINDTELIYNISWGAIVLSIVISTITIWLSCKSSAKKASKVTPIEAIRNTDDIKLKAKKVKCPKIITKIFKTGGEIAYKNLKRSKKKYRTTVISIIVSVVTFIAISSFIDFGFKMSGSYYSEIGYNVTIYDITIDDINRETNTKDNLNKIYRRFLEISKLDGIKEYSIKRSNHIEVNSENNLSDFGKLVKDRGTVIDEYDMNETNNTNDTITIISLGKEEYERFVKKIHGKYEDYKDGAILIDEFISFDEKGKKTQDSLYTWQKGDTITGKIGSLAKTENETTEKKDLNIKIVAKTTERPMGLENLYSTSALLIVSDEYIEQIGYTSLGGMDIKAEDSYKVEEEIKQFYKSKNINENDIAISNLEEQIKANNAIVLVISIFLYGFIAVITAIGITNIFNTITTNMNLRKKEFAMLKSIGMTKKEFNRMIRLESILYGLKSLIIGIPIGILLSYAIFKAFETNMGMPYMLPINAIITSIIFVAIVITIIMKYSMSKINKQNIIETIRNDNI